jgi:hypothetical protein
VIRGSLQGVEGLLTRKKNLFRLVLSVSMLAQSVSVEIDASDVEPVKPAASNGVNTVGELTGIPNVYQPLSHDVRDGLALVAG